MNLIHRLRGNQSPRPDSHAPMLVAAGIYLVLSIMHLVEFNPPALMAVLYLGLAECYRRTYS